MVLLLFIFLLALSGVNADWCRRQRGDDHQHAEHSARRAHPADQRKRKRSAVCDAVCDAGEQKNYYFQTWQTWAGRVGVSAFMLAGVGVCCLGSWVLVSCIIWALGMSVAEWSQQFSLQLDVRITGNASGKRLRFAQMTYFFRHCQIRFNEPFMNLVSVELYRWHKKKM